MSHVHLFDSIRSGSLVPRCPTGWTIKEGQDDAPEKYLVSGFFFLLVPWTQAKSFEQPQHISKRKCLCWLLQPYVQFYRVRFLILQPYVQYHRVRLLILHLYVQYYHVQIPYITAYCAVLSCTSLYITAKCAVLSSRVLILQPNVQYYHVRFLILQPNVQYYRV